MSAQPARRSHHPAHAECSADFFYVTHPAGPGADDFLQRNDVGVDLTKYGGDAIGSRSSIHAAAAMDVVSDDAERRRGGRTHYAMIAPDVPGSCATDWHSREEAPMSRLKSELEVTCPCCQSTLVIDLNLGRVISHHEPERTDKPELADAQRILAEEARRREAIFQQSVDSERTRGDALSRRFDEALKQARQEPITKPTRDFDLD
jgi:hypothetical protein